MYVWRKEYMGGMKVWRNEGTYGGMKVWGNEGMEE